MGPWAPHALNYQWVTGGPLDPPGAIRHILRAGYCRLRASDLARAHHRSAFGTRASKIGFGKYILLEEIGIIGDDPREE
jgi:hypothetical protein